GLKKIRENRFENLQSLLQLLVKRYIFKRRIIMTKDNNCADPTVIVENEKQIITIDSGIASGAAARQTISVEKEREILDEIERHYKKWSIIGISIWHL
ncbi:MAG: hypothetical protein ACR2KZ_07160, partial [Segetibacter sp.]